MLAERKAAQGIATDISAEALAVAGRNAARHGVEARLTCLQSDWLAQVQGTFDLIVSNPPYVAECDSLPAEIAEWEPTRALVAGPSGTEDLCHLIDGAEDWLAQGGSLVLELAPDQAEPMAGRAIGAGFTDVAVERDLADRARTLVAHRPERDRSAGV